MRAVCFVKRLEFELQGNIYKNAIALGDVDNDGEIELVIGNMNGDLFIYKGKKCWQKLSGLGLITAVGVGDVMNCGSNALVVICGDGWCHIYMSLQPKTTEVPVVDPKPVKLQSVHDQRIPPNTVVLLLGDIDADGNVELVIGLTDRVVRSYRYQFQSKIHGGNLVSLNKWECANQIGTLTLNYDDDELPCLLIAQPGGTFMRIRPIIPTNVDTDGKKNENHIGMKVDYNMLSSSRMRNPNISSEIVGNINQGSLKTNGKGRPYAVSTLDGTLMFVQDEEIIWSIQVDHQLFALSKLDITGDGRDEIVACAWDGHTYILDQEKHSIRFQLDEAVSGFCAGLYTLKSGTAAVPCFIYTTFTNKVFLYYDIKVENMSTESLATLIKENSDLEDVLGEDFTADKTSLKQLVNWCLYSHK